VPLQLKHHGKLNITLLCIDSVKSYGRKLTHDLRVVKVAGQRHMDLCIY